MTRADQTVINLRIVIERPVVGVDTLEREAAPAP